MQSIKKHWAHKHISNTFVVAHFVLYGTILDNCHSQLKIEKQWDTVMSVALKKYTIVLHIYIVLFDVAWCVLIIVITQSVLRGKAEWEVLFSINALYIYNQGRLSNGTVRQVENFERVLLGTRGHRVRWIQGWKWILALCHEPSK